MLKQNLSRHTKVKLNDFAIDINKTERAIIFLYCSWSPTITQLKSLMDSLVNYQDILLLVYDIDEKEALQFFDEQGLQSNGWGETYWIKNGKVISTLKKYGPQNMEELIGKNAKLLEGSGNCK
ncbi:hypothetical protein L3C95_34650 [Chitinophaga filiformis]|uniref:hypothetical protein n=1 Tax=Chitinophaga filiformis TaxID=104663 RepID=UPI001F17D810|nr:hypothetical protein [Chitinophaga filiformis]MCF6408080.1 hypothetical protein [Chitinophaga filiformis]